MLVKDTEPIEVICVPCKRRGPVDVAEMRNKQGPIWCKHCGRMISGAAFPSWLREWRDVQLNRMHAELKSRKQSATHSDAEISADGIESEFAACIVLCPGFLPTWRQCVEAGGNNRGRDLRPEWTGLQKPVEVKFTRSWSPVSGYLLVRPPVAGGADMMADFIEDSYYVLMIFDASYGGYLLPGWIDRTRFIERKKNDPVGWKPGQVHCWGVLWRDLEKVSTLVPDCVHNLVALSSAGLNIASPE